MKRALFVILVALGLVLAGWIAYQCGAFSSLLGTGRPADGGSPQGTTPAGDGEADPKRGVVALGRVEPAEGIIDIAALVGDRLERIADKVKEGEPVAKGDVLAYLESRSLRDLERQSVASQATEAGKRREAEERLADTRITGAELAVKKTETSDLDIKVQKKKVDLARANLTLATNDRNRLRDLREDKERKGLISDQEWERQLLVVQQAGAELSAAEAMLEKLERTAALSLGAAEADVEAAKASKAAARAAIPVESLMKRSKLAEKQYEQTEIKAPCKGTVLKIFMRPGETITHQPILQMADLSKMVVVAEVYETDVKRVVEGQTAVIQSKAFAKPYDKKGLRGTVERIAGMITPPELKSLDPLASADRRVVEVRIRLDGENSTVAAGLVNLQVDVTIRPKESAEESSDPPQKP